MRSQRHTGLVGTAIWIVFGIALGAGATALWLHLQGGTLLSTQAIPRPELSEDNAATLLITSAHYQLMDNQDSAASWLQYGMTLEVGFFPDFAIAAYRRAHELDPDNVEAAYYLAINLTASGQPEEAIDLLETLTRRSPDYPPFFAHLGDAQTAAGLPDQAAESYGSAVELDPTSFYALRGLGTARLATGDPEGAREALEQAAQLVDEDLRTYAMLSQTYARLGDSQRAEELAAQAESMDEWFGMTDSLRLPVFRLQPRVRQAQVNARDAILRGEYDAALEPLQIVAMGWPNDRRVHEQLAKAYEAVGNADAAARHLEIAADLNDGDATDLDAAQLEAEQNPGSP